MAQVGQHGPQNAARINTMMLKKAVILCSQHRLNLMFGNLFNRNQLPPLALRAEKLHDFLGLQFQNRNALSIVLAANGANGIVAKVELSQKSSAFGPGRFQIV